MKTRLTFATSLLCSYFLLFVGQSAMATKHSDVTERSNGFPSPTYVNLTIHGKDAVTSTCNAMNGRNFVFINKYGQSTGQYVKNRLSAMTRLTALAPCTPKRMTVHRHWSSFPVNPKATMPLLALGDSPTMAPAVR